MINIILNGESKSIRTGITVYELVADFGFNSKNIAIEKNLETLPKSIWKKTVLQNGDSLEIVRFIGGGNKENIDIEDYWLLAGKKYTSRLIIGTGKYYNYKQNLDAALAAEVEIVTVALRRVNISNPKEPMLSDYIKPEQFTYLPNTAGCYNAEEALRTLRLAKEVGGWNLVKLEVLGDKETLYPDMEETLKATKILVKEGFEVMVYCTDDPLYAKKLEEAGSAAIMPLGAPIGSGLGIQNPLNIRLIVENSKIPVIVDAGVGTASDATLAMELGCSAVLINTAIAKANKPEIMAEAMKFAIKAGRKAYIAGRMQKQNYGAASSPEQGLIRRSKNNEYN